MCAAVVAVIAAVFPALRMKLVHGFLSLGKYWSSSDNSGNVTWSPQERGGGLSWNSHRLNAVYM